jgi:hypothetical protein
MCGALSMITDLFLIAHKVRGEPAFDIAEHMTCPKCEGDGKLSNGIIDITGDDGCIDCTQCDGQGHWWIIPTSGHRAFPYWNSSLNAAVDWEMQRINNNPMIDMPPSLRDHYTTEREAATDLIKVLGLIHKPLAPLAPIKRRF